MSSLNGIDFEFAGEFEALRKFEYAINMPWPEWLNWRSQNKSFEWKELVGSTAYLTSSGRT